MKPGLYFRQYIINHCRYGGGLFLGVRLYFPFRFVDPEGWSTALHVGLGIWTWELRLERIY